MYMKVKRHIHQLPLNDRKIALLELSRVMLWNLLELFVGIGKCAPGHFDVFKFNDNVTLWGQHLIMWPVLKYEGIRDTLLVTVTILGSLTLVKFMCGTHYR